MHSEEDIFVVNRQAFLEAAIALEQWDIMRVILSDQALYGFNPILELKPHSELVRCHYSRAKSALFALFMPPEEWNRLVIEKLWKHWQTGQLFHADWKHSPER